MKRTARGSRKNLTSDLQKIATLAPFVAARRVSTMVTGAAGGKSPIPALTRMGAEKASVAAASATAMMFAAGAVFAQSAFAFANAWSPWGGTTRQRLMRIQTAVGDAPTRIVAKGIAPVRKKVAANSRARSR